MRTLNLCFWEAVSTSLLMTRQLRGRARRSALRGLTERHAEVRQQRAALCVGRRAVVTMLMFMPLIESILSYSISGKMICSRTPMVKLPRPSKPRGDTPRKSRTRGSAMLHEPVEELPHALAAQRDHHADLLALAELEDRDVLLRARDHRRLAGDRLELLDRVVDHLGLVLALPRPMLTVIFTIRGTCMTVE